MVLALTNIPKSLFYSLETNERLFLVVQTKSKAELEVSEGQDRRIKTYIPSSDFATSLQVLRPSA